MSETPNARPDCSSGGQMLCCYPQRVRFTCSDAVPTKSTSETLLRTKKSYKGGEVLSCCWRVATVETGMRERAIEGLDGEACMHIE